MKKFLWCFLGLWALAFPVFAEKPELVDIHSVHPNIVVDIRYATPHNFTKETLYPYNRCVLQEDAAQRLSLVQEALEKEGLGLKVWDCYRPLSIQKKLWKLVPDDRYVANPKEGSRHNRGAAVDLTLIDRQGQELPMPTPYDDFTEKAHRDYQNLSAEAKANRTLLEKAMSAQGFEGLPTEWWHFDAPAWKNHPVMDKKLLNVFQWPALSRQAIVVTTDNWDAITGTLERWERTEQGWVKRGEAWPMTVGRNGLAWGRGLHPENLKGPMKKEGDGKAPAGVYTLGPAYGYSAKPLPGSLWPYHPSGPSLRCVDDTASAFYNTIVDSATVTADWNSSELMRREDALYEWLVVVEHNSDQITSGEGSCIFLHLWRAPQAPTAGCTSLAKPQMEELLRWLDPQAKPLLVQLTKTSYQKYKKSWNLP